MLKKKVMTTKELAERWKLKLVTIHKWRKQNRGCKYTEKAGYYFYDIKDVEEYEAENWTVHGVPIKK